MHQVAHLVAQFTVGGPTASGSSTRAKAVDDGAFGESLRASIEAAAAPANKAATRSARTAQDKADSSGQQVATEERTNSAEGSNIAVPANAAKAEPSQLADEAGPAGAVKKSTTKPAAAQKEAAKPAKDVAAQDTDASQLQTVASPVNETAQPSPIAAVAGVAAPVAASDPSAPKVQSDGLKPAAPSAAGATGRATRPEVKKAESTAGAGATLDAATRAETTSSAPVAPVRSGDTPGAAAGSAAVVAHVTAAPAAAPKLEHADAVTADPVRAESAEVQTLVATPKVLEIGVASDAHGWLRVRAEVDGAGEISAAVVATSAGAAEGLHRELPAISAYLAGEQVGLSSLVVHAAGSVVATQDAMYGAGAGAAGAGAESGSNQAPRSSLPQFPGGAQDGTDLEDASAMLAVPTAVFGNGTGSWLSVRV